MRDTRLNRNNYSLKAVYIYIYMHAYVVCLKSSANGLIKKQTLEIRSFIVLQSSPRQTQRTFDNVHMASGNCQKIPFLEPCSE